MKNDNGSKIEKKVLTVCEKKDFGIRMRVRIPNGPVPKLYVMEPDNPRNVLAVLKMTQDLPGTAEDLFFESGDNALTAENKNAILTWARALRQQQATTNWYYWYGQLTPSSLKE